MRRFVLATLLLASCGDGLSPEEQAIQDERDIKLVEETNDTPPPLKPVIPQAIGFPEIEQYDLFGKACNYAPGTSFGTLVVAREADAYMKIDGAMVRFAADPGARELAIRTRSVYNSLGYTLRLELEGEGEQSGPDQTNYEGTVTLRDGYGRVVYEGAGLAQCGS